MSLISDTNFLIHSLRLSYLRDVEDPYGPRLINLDPAYNSNPYIIAASLTDVDRWPELAMPSSPHLSEDEDERPSRFPGARLKHTQTIMGGKSGGLGMRIHGKRMSASKRFSGTPRQEDVKNFISNSAPVQEPLTTTTTVASPGPVPEPVVENAEASDSEPAVQIQEPSVPEEAPVNKVVQFIPKFKGAAEMERRRRMRMAARRAPGGPTAVLHAQTLAFSSSDEDTPLTSNSSSDEFDEDGHGVVHSMDDGDEFDPEYSTTRTALHSDSASDVLSVISAATNSMSNSSAPISASHVASRSRVRLSPVSEAAADGGDRQLMDDRLGDMSFEMVNPPAKVKQGGRTFDGSSSRGKVQGSSSHNVSSSTSILSPEISFARKKVPPIKPMRSALSAMLASSDASSNPFAENYAAVSGRGESASTDVHVYFPHARHPAGKAMVLNVKRDATVEEVIGFALLTYWKDGWLPKLDEGLSGEDDPKWETKVSAVGWIMRIAEDDGEVDDDFPPPDRLGRITRFNADAYAILEATPAQIQQNQVIESKIERLPSRTKKSEKVAAAPLTVTSSSSGAFASNLGSVALSTSLGPSSSHGPQIFLRIRVDTADAVHISTTIPVSAGMYMQEALELVCRRRKLANPKEYALLLADKSILIPLDRTVASLQGNRELLLVKRSMLPGHVFKEPGKTTDPNDSIFKRMSDTPEDQYSSMVDYTAGYKKYTIFRKAPMLLARQERTLAIDGVYIHIMPSSNKAMKVVFETGKTSSYHIKSIADCQQSTKSSSTFKIVLNRAAGNKRYDFEAESPRLAAEIVQSVKSLKASVERSGTVSKSRRSRQVA